MIELNDTNGASHWTQIYAGKAMNEFDGILFGAEMGIAYGGGVERIGKLWGKRGIVYGFDTFEGHPKEVGERCEYSKEAGGVSSFAATCMDSWYANPDFGTDRISLQYIQSELDRQGLSNVKLVKGLITSETDVSFVPHLHYCLIDLDFPVAMWDAYNLIKDKIVKNGYLLLHDVIPKGHIHGCYEIYQRMLGEGLFEIVEEKDNYLLSILRKR